MPFSSRLFLRFHQPCSPPESCKCRSAIGATRLCSQTQRDSYPRGAPFHLSAASRRCHQQLTRREICGTSCDKCACTFHTHRVFTTALDPPRWIPSAVLLWASGSTESRRPLRCRVRGEAERIFRRLRIANATHHFFLSDKFTPVSRSIAPRRCFQKSPIGNDSTITPVDESLDAKRCKRAGISAPHYPRDDGDCFGVDELEEFRPSESCTRNARMGTLRGTEPSMTTVGDKKFFFATHAA